MINLGEEDSMLPEYGNDQLQVVLVNFYGEEAMVEFGGKTYTPPLVNEEEMYAERRICKRALAKEKKMMMEKNIMSRTSCVLCKHSNGERASLANFKIDYRLFVGMLLVWQKLS